MAVAFFAGAARWLVETRAVVVFDALAAATLAPVRFAAAFVAAFVAGAFAAAEPPSPLPEARVTSAPVARPGVRALRSSTGPRNRPVWLSATSRPARACPRRRSVPPPSPPSGPRSMIQSAVLITSRLCSMTMTVLPLSTSPLSTSSSLRMSSKCRPVVGSSRT